MRDNQFAKLNAFVAIADHGNFTRAASHLGIATASLSLTIRSLEEQLGVRLLNRTTRSVSLTDAGLRLLDRLRPAMSQINSALEDLDQERDRPFGNLRIHASHLAATAVVAPVWARFLSTYPAVHLELQVDEAPIDIVARGIDAGIGPKDQLAADMVIVRVTGPMKVAVVGSPAYFARRRPPRSPDELVVHNCIQYRLAANGTMFAWAFEQNESAHSISVEGRVMVNNPDLAVRAAVDGLGIAYTLDGMADLFLRSGQLVRVLEDWSPSFEGLYLYHPSHRQVPAALRAFIDMIQAERHSAGAGNLIENPFNGQGMPHWSK